MNALVFLVRKQIRNFFRELVRHPSHLILYVIVIGSFALTFIASAKDPPRTRSYQDIRVLHGIFLAWLLFMTVPSLFRSLKSGTTMFKMSDVNFLFVSPLPPKMILNYGVLKQAAATLFGFVFLIFCSGSLMSSFHITMIGVVWLVFGSVLAVITVQVISLLAYSWSNGRPARQNAVRAVLYAFFGAMALAVLFLFRRNGGGVEGILAAVSSPYLEYFPVVGWTKGAVFALIAGNVGSAAVYLGLLAALFALTLVLFERTDTDYYEDVLHSTETLFETQQAVKEKRAVAARPSGRKVRVGRTGLGGGWGASTFFYKHLCEARRRSRLVFISASTVLITLADMVLVYFVSYSSKGDSDAPSADMLLAIALLADVYILFLMNAAGDWSRELTKPYIYLVPADPFRKLLWASLTSVVKPAVDGAVIFAVLCVFVHANPLTGAAGFLAYASFGLIFLAGNVLSQRTMGSMANRGLLMFLYMLLLLVLIAPGVVGSIALGGALGPNAGAGWMLLAALPMIGWNVAVSLVILFCCRNLLANAESAS